MKAATWALEHGVNVVICNGSSQLTIKSIMAGRKVGTFFTQVQQTSSPPEVQAAMGQWNLLSPPSSSPSSSRSSSRSSSPSSSPSSSRSSLLPPHHQCRHPSVLSPYLPPHHPPHPCQELDMQQAFMHLYFGTSYSLVFSLE